jgi:hypothetical protein
MKKYIFICALCMPALNLLAQEPADALRYSWITQNGTARNQAIGGASISLGGEFTNLFTNPAGLGFYKTNEFVISPSGGRLNTENKYLKNTTEANKGKFNLGASGILFSVVEPSQTAPLRNVTVALGINQAASFNNRLYYKGTNNRSSYSEKYLEELINNDVRDPNDAARNFPYGSSLALNTYLIDTVTVNAQFGYRSLANPATGLIQENKVNQSGSVTDLAIGAALNFHEKWFVGGTLTVPVIYYKRQSTYRETDATSVKTNNFNFFEVKENLETQGFGLNAKLGVIYKPVEYVRLGLAVTTPTYFSLTETYQTDITTDLEGYGGAGTKKQSSLDFTNNEPGKFKYDQISPWKVAASASYVFREVENVKRQRAFITADVEYVNHKASSFHEVDDSEAGTGDYLKDLKRAIDREYKGTFNFKLGGELKFHTIMFRLGGAYYGNPYKNDKAHKINLGGGLGYRDRGIFIDLSYVHSLNKDVHYPYKLEDNPGFDKAYVNGEAGTVALTIGFKL